MTAPATSPPITYSVNGVQYVAIMAGGEAHDDPTGGNPRRHDLHVRPRLTRSGLGWPPRAAATPSGPVMRAECLLKRHTLRRVPFS